MQILDEMVQPPQSSTPEPPDRPSERLSSDESLWEATAAPSPVPVPAPGPTPPEAAGRRPPWRRALRVNLLLAGGAVALLLVGFVLGAAVGGGERPAPTTVPPPASATAAVTATSIVVRPGPPPRSCTSALEAADRAIAYLVEKTRDNRLTAAIRKYVDAKRACLRAVR